jgi:beta-lactam-binding protein with PASTA domain
MVKGKSMEAGNRRTNNRRTTCNSMGASNISEKGKTMDISIPVGQTINEKQLQQHGYSNSMNKSKSMEAGNRRTNTTKKHLLQHGHQQHQ